MEFVVALFGDVAGAAVSKLVKVIDESKNKTDSVEMRSNAIFLKEELMQIKATMETYDYRANGGHTIPFQLRVSIAALRRLAYDIEDCIDSFNPTKMTSEDFATEIRALKDRAKEMRKQIPHYAGPIPQWFIGTAERLGLLIISFFPILSKILKWAFGAPILLNLDCLLVYLCLFPPNHPVRTKPLIRRWLAEGLVQAEHLAVKNFRSFVDSSYISSIQRSINGNVKRCQPSHKTLQLISQQSMSENFILICDGTAEMQAEEARRLSVHPPANGVLNLPRDLSRLRTLAVFPAAGATSLASYEDVLDFKRYKVLRVLDLKECGHLSEEHLNDILINHRQVLMKYLSINLGSINRITSEISLLNQLETLDLSGTKTVTVFEEVLLLPELKHLLGKFQLSKTDTFSAPLLGLFVSGLEKFLERRSKLETLAGFVTDKRYGFPQLVSLMRRLRKVKIWCKPSASQRNLSDISKAIWKFSRDGTRELHGRSLTIDFQGCSGHFLNTEHPDAAGGRLDSLKLRGHLSVFPKFVEKLSVIQELCLCSTGLSWMVIRDGLKDVRGLKYLKLIEDNLGESLPTVVQANALPDLVSLHIICQNLDVSPGSPGIEISHMKNLKEVALHHQVHDAIRTEWQQAVDAHPNETVPILLFIQGP